MAEEAIEIAGDRGGRRAAAAEYRREVRELVDLLSNLNPSAEEFVPSSRSSHGGGGGGGGGRRTTRSGGALSAEAAPLFMAPHDYYAAQMINAWFHDAAAINDGGLNDWGLRDQYSRRSKSSYSERRRRSSVSSIQKAQREDSIKKTVYISEIDRQITEEQLAALFSNCGKVVDCRICGDANSALRFAFVEFASENGARAALNLGGTMLGYHPVRVLPSKTAILPVNPTFLPQSEDEREMCTRTVYCTNIDKKVTQNDLKSFFESNCGEVSRLRLLGDRVHSTRIAFVEFAEAEGALAALSCSGLFVGNLRVRVSPSKTPVRPRTPRSAMAD
ncbi:polyadenylate-binding protein-interacting protein 11-like [Ananas comosus]|uniref:Polyadenylate-binding protein-interacting protein 11-like n=2 Tax=Ananas comosus TaxID=4615 RepID=A0A199W7C2_ANACO|nr:polyadenylate-binding protein-interacting protein 11-like [Ananas comosus]OAY85141.1 Polyadenylate-binding protein-interacting protein 9 [Ananas comosus]